MPRVLHLYPAVHLLCVCFIDDLFPYIVLRYAHEQKARGVRLIGVANKMQCLCTYQLYATLPPTRGIPGQGGDLTSQFIKRPTHGFMFVV